MKFFAIALLALLGATACAVEAGEGSGAREPNRDPVVTRDDGVEAPGESRATHVTDRERAIILYRQGDREAALERLRRGGGRVLATFNEPALIVLLSRHAAVELQRESRLVVAFDPVDSPDLLASAPGAIGFWNRQLGVSVDAPTAPPGREATPTAGLARHARPELGSEIEMPRALEAQAQSTLRGFMSCVARLGANGDHDCMGSYLVDDLRRRYEAQLGREASVVAERNVDVSTYEFELDAFDGRLARYEIQLLDRPTGTIHLERREETWTVSHIDP